MADQRKGPYAARRLRDHPLGSGHFFVHQLVLFDKIGFGPHHCTWCAKPINWMRPKIGESRVHMLVVDHLDNDTRNNSPENLVPSCLPCNAWRDRADRTRDDELVRVRSNGARVRQGLAECERCSAVFASDLSQIANPKKARFCSRSCARRSLKRRIDV